jgi:hypothetical protein
LLLLLLVTPLVAPKFKTTYRFTATFPQKFNRGQALYDAALAAQQQQKVEYGEQIGATDRLNQAWEVASKSYIKFLKIARIAFKDNGGIATQLGLNLKASESWNVLNLNLRVDIHCIKRDRAHPIS